MRPRVALVMGPMRHRDETTPAEMLYNLAKGQPHYLKDFNRLRRSGVVDFRSYPLGLIWLATVARERYEVRIFNFLQGDTRVEDLVAFAPDVVGVTASTGSLLLWLDELMVRVRRETGAAILVGGPHATLDPERTLATTPADFVVTGEADEIFVPLLDHICGQGGALPDRGVWRMDGGVARGGQPAVVEDLSRLVLPDHGLLDPARYPGVHIETSRGCPFACEFCYMSGFGPCRDRRTRPVEAVVRELQQVARLRDLERSKVYLVDNNFRDNDYIHDLLDALEQADLKARFWTATDTFLDRRALRRMHGRGFFFLHSGVEHSEPTAFDKVPSREHLGRYLRRASEEGVMVGADYVLCYPGQTPAGLRDTVELARRLSQELDDLPGPRITHQPHLFRPHPGTEITGQLARDTSWEPPATFAGWGQLHDDISAGRLDRFNAGDGLRRRDLVSTQLAFALLNLRYHLGPMMLQLLGGAVRARLRRLFPGRADPGEEGQTDLTSHFVMPAPGPQERP